MKIFVLNIIFLALPIYLLAGTEADKYLRAAMDKGQDRKDAEALQLMEKAVELEKENGKMYFYRGFFKEGVKDYKGALLDYSKAIKLGYKTKDVYLSRAYIFEQANNFETAAYKYALDDYNTAVSLGANDTYTFLCRGKVKRTLKDFEGAEQDMLKVLEMDENNVGALIELSMVSGDKKKCVQYANKAAEIDPENSNVFFVRYCAKKVLSKDDVEAISDLDRAIELNPEFAEAYIARAFERDRQGMKEEALSDFMVCRKLGVNEAEPEIERLMKETGKQ